MPAGIFADTFDVLKKSYLTLWIMDYGSTLTAMQHDGIVELNPIAKHYVNAPEVFTPITFSLMVVQDWGLSKLRKWNKTVAYIFLGVLTAVKMYVVFNNFEALSLSH